MCFLATWLSLGKSTASACALQAHCSHDRIFYYPMFGGRLSDHDFSASKVLLALWSLRSISLNVRPPVEDRCCRCASPFDRGGIVAVQVS